MFQPAMSPGGQPCNRDTFVFCLKVPGPGLDLKLCEASQQGGKKYDINLR